MIYEAETWVAVAFLLFFVVLGYFGVHKTLLGGLDKRAGRIQQELDEARRLKEEAQRMHADYSRKQQEARGEADAIIAEAKAEAERLAAEASVKLEEFIARRTKLAEQKIAQAEVQALADVRNAAAEAAVSAAEGLLAMAAKGSAADALVAKGIDDVKKKLN